MEEYLHHMPLHPLLHAQPPDVCKTEEQLPRATRRTLAQLRAQKCPMLQHYLHSIGAAEDPRCPLCGHEEHTTAHLFVCPNIETQLTPVDLWRQSICGASQHKSPSCSHSGRKRWKRNSEGLPSGSFTGWRDKKRPNALPWEAVV